MQIKFWGVRGSIPTPGGSTVRYGGNTSCIEVRGEDDTLIILDAGTGIRPLGEVLVTKPPRDMHLFISHTHWDHIHGFPFFIPAYVPGNAIHIYGPTQFDKSLKEVMARQMDYSYFPINISNEKVDRLDGVAEYRDLKQEVLNIGDLTVRTKLMNHPVAAFGYRIEEGERSIVYTGDHEKYYDFMGEGENEDDLKERNQIIEDLNQQTVDFVKGVDLLIADAQYLEEEYPSKVGWGHSHIYQTLDLAIKGEVKNLVLFHHEPKRSDDEMDQLLEKTRIRCKELGSDLKITAAIEGESIQIL